MAANATSLQDFSFHSSLLDAVLADPPHWANEVLLPWDEVLFQRVQSFVTDKYWSSQHSINVFSVVGTQHPDYAGMTWLEFLQRGKRMRQNLRLHALNRDYYFDTAVKQPPIYYVSMDGLRWYVAGDGNHRTCIARFDFHGAGSTMLHGVHLEDYRVDWTFWRLYQNLKQVLGDKVVITPQRRCIARKDTGGWMHENYEISLLLNEKGREIRLDRRQTDILLHERLGKRKSLLWRWRR